MKLLTVGVGLTVTVTWSVFVQPAAVTVSVYVVGIGAEPVFTAVNGTLLDIPLFQA